MSPSEMLASNAVAITFGAKVFGGWMWLVPLGVACSTFGACNGLLFTSARLPYAAAHNGHVPAFLSYLSVDRLTPVMSVMLISTISIIMIIPPSCNIGQLLDIFSFAMWTVYGLTFISIILFRFVQPFKSAERPFKIWLPLPIFCACISIYIVVAPLIENPSLAYLLTVVIILSGLILYVPFVWLEWKLPFYDRCVVFCQKYFEIVP